MSARPLNGKRVLFLCPAFFGYEKSIKEALVKMGATVVYFDERPSNSTMGKAFLRINPKLIQKKIQEHYQLMLEKIAGQAFDYILICQAEATPVFFLQKLKEIYPDARMILYLWDSIKNKKHSLEKTAYFDHVASFDFDDCQKNAFHFRPLFFEEKYLTLAEKTDYVYSLFFVGTIHSDRYTILEQVKRIFLESGKNVFFYYYIPSKLMFFYYKYFKKIIPGSYFQDFHYAPLDKDELAKKLSDSGAVIDIQHPAQTGLTMRTIEMLGANKKLITTNAEVKHYDFYESGNICVIERENIQIPASFLNTPYKKIAPEIKERYSLPFFILELLGVVKGGEYYR